MDAYKKEILFFGRGSVRGKMQTISIITQSLKSIVVKIGIGEMCSKGLDKKREGRKTTLS